jgi:single-strand DNA-binding protein
MHNDSTENKEGAMLNQVVLVGRVAQMPEIKETASGIKLAQMLIEVDRSFRNSQGEYEHDLFLCTLWRGIAESAIAHCEVGSIIGVKGRLQAGNFDTKEHSKFYYCEVVAEKVSFLTNR